MEIKKELILPEVLCVIERLAKRQFTTFLVGGCIRDLLLGRPVRDWDIVCDAEMVQIKNLFRDYKMVIIGKSVLTVTLITNRTLIQISIFRYSHNNVFHREGHNQNQQTILKADLLKRDFTINAIAWHPETDILDPLGGIDDLRRKIIRCKNPDLRILEDPLRMIRAIRISSELGFTISDETKQAIRTHAHLIQKIARERIQKEITLILRSVNPKEGILMMHRLGIDAYVIKPVAEGRAIFSKSEKNRQYLSKVKEWSYCLAVQLALWGRFCFDSFWEIRSYFFPSICQLKFNKNTLQALQVLLRQAWQDLDFSSSLKIRYSLSRYGYNMTRILFSLKKSTLEIQEKKERLSLLANEELHFEEELQKNNPVNLRDLAINGYDLLGIGYSSGKEIGQILNTLLSEVLKNPDLNHKITLLRLAQNFQKRP